MAVVTSDILTAITTNFRALWEDQFLAARPEWQQKRELLAMTVNSQTLKETYTWLNTVPKMREWLSERQLGGLVPSDLSITNKDWESTIEVDRNMIEDDRLSLVRPRISQLALEAARFPFERLSAIIGAGTAATYGLAFDGQYFFDTDHVTPGATYQTNQSNKLSGSGTALNNIRTDYEAAVAAMQMFRDDEGRPMTLRPTHVMCPPALEGKFKQLLNGDFFPHVLGTDAGVTPDNIWKGTAELIVNPYLTDLTDWYLLCLDQPVKPFIYQSRKEPEFVALDNPTDQQAFMRKKFLYGVDSRFEVGYGLWQMAIRTTNSD